MFYLDTDRAEIGRVNLKDNEKSTLFENLENPGTVLTFDPASQSVFWVEGRGETAKLRAGRWDGGGKPITMAKSPAVNGLEKIIAYNPYNKKVYYLRDRKVRTFV